MKKYAGNIWKTRTLFIYGLCDLEKFRARPFINVPGGKGVVCNFQVWGTPEKRHETCQKNNNNIEKLEILLSPYRDL